MPQNHDFHRFFTLKLRNSVSIDAYILCRHSLNDLLEAEHSLLKKNIDNHKYFQYFDKNNFVELHVAFHRGISICSSDGRSENRAKAGQVVKWKRHHNVIIACHL